MHRRRPRGWIDDPHCLRLCGEVVAHPPLHLHRGDPRRKHLDGEVRYDGPPDLPPARQLCHSDKVGAWA